MEFAKQKDEVLEATIPRKKERKQLESDFRKFLLATIANSLQFLYKNK